MLSESLAKLDPSQSAMAKTKEQLKSSSCSNDSDGGPGRFLIRIPRSVATSPYTSADLNVIDSPEKPEEVMMKEDNKDSCLLPNESHTGCAHWSQAPPGNECSSIGSSLKSSQQNLKEESLSSSHPKQLVYLIPQQCTGQGIKKHLPFQESVDNIIPTANNDKPIEPIKKDSLIYFLGSVKYEPFKPMVARKKDQLYFEFDVKIPSRAMKNNLAIKKRCIWGGQDGLYTDDSDAVCILLHSSAKIDFPKSPFIKATFKILPRCLEYPAIDEEMINSRSWKRHTGYSIKLISVRPFNGPARSKKTHTPRPTDACTIKFSNQSKTPVMLLTELLLLPNQLQTRIKEEKVPLYLVGHHHSYILSYAHGHYLLCRNNLDLFNDLDWKDIKWLESGLSIRNTFLSLYGYHW